MVVIDLVKGRLPAPHRLVFVALSPNALLEADTLSTLSRGGRSYLALIVDCSRTCEVAFIVSLLQDRQWSPAAEHLGGKGRRITS